MYIGVALYHSENGPLANNSVVVANNGFLFGSFFGVSGRGQAGIGHWIAPNGEDYTQPGTHPFEVRLGGGHNKRKPGYRSRGSVRRSIYMETR